MISSNCFYQQLALIDTYINPLPRAQPLDPCKSSAQLFQGLVPREPSSKCSSAPLWDVWQGMLDH